jgi:hypothetical protein
MVGRRFLLLAALLTSAITVLHIVIVFVGAPGYRYFGAGEQIARLAEQGSPVPALLTLCIAAIFAVFSLYAFSGSGVLRRLPLVRLVLLMIGTIFALRGIAVIPQLIQMAHQGRPLLHRAVVFSAVSLCIGVIYLLGTALQWNALAPGRKMPGA